MAEIGTGKSSGQKIRQEHCVPSACDRLQCHRHSDRMLVVETSEDVITTRALGLITVEPRSGQIRLTEPLIKRMAAKEHITRVDRYPRQGPLPGYRHTSQ